MKMIMIVCSKAVFVRHALQVAASTVLLLLQKSGGWQPGDLRCGSLVVAVPASWCQLFAKSHVGCDRKACVLPDHARLLKELLLAYPPSIHVESISQTMPSSNDHAVPYVHNRCNILEVGKVLSSASSLATAVAVHARIIAQRGTTCMGRDPFKHNQKALVTEARAAQQTPWHTDATAISGFVQLSAKCFRP